CLFDGSSITGSNPGANIGIISGSSNIEIENNQFIVTTTGCLIENCNNAIIRNCSFQGGAANTTAVSCTSCKKISLEQCVAEKVSQGFLIHGCNDVSISECESLGLAVAGNIGFSLSVTSIENPPTTNVTLERCIATNHDTGFQIDNATTRFTLKHCIAQNNSTDGFQIDTSGTGIVKGCKAEANGQYGFNDVIGGANITYVANVASNNGTANYNPAPLTPFYPVSLIDSPMYWNNAIQ
ncbi:MAG: right-handed parallel beta-helix repeat-containing protein, partial [Methylophilaceae bacterium]|nr:right-handed parallel beta-helix repeat-containing protein [Methylophilaceae bacterium]